MLRDRIQLLAVLQLRIVCQAVVALLTTAATAAAETAKDPRHDRRRHFGVLAPDEATRMDDVPQKNR